MDTVEVLDSVCAETKENDAAEDTIEAFDDTITRHEDAPFVASDGEETETTPANEVVESGETKRNNKCKRSSSCFSKKAVSRPAEKTKRQQEEAATAAAQAKIEARRHEIDLARANHSEVLVKDCTINLTCCDSEHKFLVNTVGSIVQSCDSPEFKEAFLKALSATKTSE